MVGTSVFDIPNKKMRIFHGNNLNEFVVLPNF